MSKCQCSMTGDGCRYCQPQKYIGWMSEWLQESQEKASSLEEERDTLRKQVVEACELLNDSRNKINYMRQNGERYQPQFLLERIDAWLEANK